MGLVSDLQISSLPTYRLY